MTRNSRRLTYSPLSLKGRLTVCGILGPTAGEGWLAYVGVDDEYPELNDLAREIDDAMWEAARFVLYERSLEDPVLRVMADDRCQRWTWATVQAGAMPVGTKILAKYGNHTTWLGRLRPLDSFERERARDFPEERGNRLGVTWIEQVSGDSNWRPDVERDTEVEALVPVPFDMSALLAEIERESNEPCRPVRKRRQPGVQRTCRVCGRTGTRGFRVTENGTWCAGLTACRRRKAA